MEKASAYSIINFPSSFQKSFKKQLKAHHSLILLPSLPNIPSQLSNPSTQNLFPKGNYSVTFNPLSTKATPKSSIPNIKENHRQSIENLTIAIINTPTLKLIFIIYPIYAR